MNALMPKFEIDKKVKPRLNMAALADTLKDAANIEGLTPIDINSPEHLKHYFANGAYVREMILPPNTAVVGRIHKHETINILLEGELTVVDETGNKKEFKAPHVFIAPAGNQKAAYTKTKVRWLNSWACDTTDPDEALGLLTCETMEEYQDFQLEIESKKDVKLLTSELGLTDDQMCELVNSGDLACAGSEYDHIYIDESEIDCLGLFSEYSFIAGDIISPMRVKDKRTLAGRYSNHAIKPNSEARFIGGIPHLVAISEIKPNQEITCNYRQVLKARGLEGDL